MIEFVAVKSSCAGFHDSCMLDPVAYADVKPANVGAVESLVVVK
jgi:hypothetical protein